MNDDKQVRIDKWLWAARFYKTRTLAANAVTNGRVKLNGARIKPSKQLRLNDKLIIQSAPYSWDIQVTSLAERRVSAVLAKTMYEESVESQTIRAELTELLKLEKKAKYSNSERSPNQKRS